MENNIGDRVGTEGLLGQTACLQAAVPSGTARGPIGAILIRAVWDGAILEEFRENTNYSGLQRVIFFFPVYLKIFFRLDRRSEMKGENTPGVWDKIVFPMYNFQILSLC